MVNQLIDILFKDYRRRILGLLLLHPERAFHVREIARLTGTIAGTTGRELRKLADAGVLSTEKRGNQIVYQADRQCPIFQELASILRKTSGLAEVLAEALLPIADQLDAAFVYGSMAGGSADNNSDIDLCVIGSASFSEIVQALYDSQQILMREINPKCFSREEWLKKHDEKSVYMEELLNKPIINVIGNRDDVRQFAGKHAGIHSAR